MTNEDIVAFILSHEGSAYTDDPVDAGGCSKYGVTRRALASFRHVPLSAITCEDVRNLTQADAEALALELYIFRPNFHQIADWRLRLAVVDFGYHSGAVTATKALQRAVGVADDGSFGRDTGWAVVRADAERVRLKVVGARMRLLGSLIERRRSNARFAGGWFDRVADVLEAA